MIIRFASIHPSIYLFITSFIHSFIAILLLTLWDVSIAESWWMPSDGGIDSSWKAPSDQHQERLFQKHNAFVTEPICLAFSRTRAANGELLGAPLASKHLISPEFPCLWFHLTPSRTSQERFPIWRSRRCDCFGDFKALKLLWYQTVERGVFVLNPPLSTVWKIASKWEEQVWPSKKVHPERTAKC